MIWFVSYHMYVMYVPGETAVTQKKRNGLLYHTKNKTNNIHPATEKLTREKTGDPRAAAARTQTLHSRRPSWTSP